MSNYFYNKYNADQQSALLNKEKAGDLADRVSQFGSVDSFDDAIKLADKIIPTVNELTSFNSGNAKCTVFRTQKQLRVTLETSDDFVCYDFS